MILHIRNMTTVTSKIVVEQALQELAIPYIKIGHGNLEITNPLSTAKKEQLSQKLLQLELELLEDNKHILAEKVKDSIYEMVRLSNDLPKINYSDYLSKQLNYDYTYIANIFIEITGVTIRDFIINYKVEKVKELIMNDELNLTEISNKLNYSSIGHLSNQFKKVTGLSPTDYKKLTLQSRL
ncbi:MAG TPA: AraC family transcriptional regulator [Chitinophagaceae bacterium]|nr:AraC family transcriptional regulator [Chitinophagaceae bacterium]